MYKRAKELGLNPDTLLLERQINPKRRIDTHDYEDVIKRLRNQKESKVCKNTIVFLRHSYHVKLRMQYLREDVFFP